MSRKQHAVTLTTKERKQLLDLVQTGSRLVRVVRRAQILLKSDQGLIDAEIAEHVGCCERHVREIRKRFCVHGLERALHDAPRSGTPPRFASRQRQQILALVHQSPRNFGKKRSTWTLQLLADTCLEIGITDAKVGVETVRQTLKRIGVKWRRAELWMTSPDPHYTEKKAQRDRFIHLADRHPEWVVGFLDEVWWSRIARPPLRAWSAGGPVKMHLLSRRVDDPDPVALCCYGLLRQDTDRVMLRFVEGRPVGNVTAQFLAWVCNQLEVERKTRLIVIWDDASWHSGRPVSDWIAKHNRRVKRNGGVQIVLCPLPVKSPWLNNIETRWGPAKRAILEPNLILTGQEVVSRVSEHFGTIPLPYLKSRTVKEIDVEFGS